MIHVGLEAKQNYIFMTFFLKLYNFHTIFFYHSCKLTFSFTESKCFQFITWNDRFQREIIMKLGKSDKRVYKQCSLNTLNPGKYQGCKSRPFVGNVGLRLNPMWQFHTWNCIICIFWVPQLIYPQVRTELKGVN